MTISKDLFLAILSMDSYNRGYGAGIEGLGGEGTQIGAATLGKDAEQLLDQGSAQAAGFYAIAYDVKASGVEGIDSDTTVISYRGTDTPNLHNGRIKIIRMKPENRPVSNRFINIPHFRKFRCVEKMQL